MSSIARTIRRRVRRRYTMRYHLCVSLSLAHAVRDAAWLGIADVQAGRVQGFGSPRELDQHFDAIAESAIAFVR